MFSDKFWKYFFEIYEAIPRQGPGDRNSTEKALKQLPTLKSSQRILDIGCGKGVQTLDLAQSTKAQIVAVDSHPPFVAHLEKRVLELNLAERVSAQVGDMNDLQFPAGSFDVIWSEGAIFIIGFDAGLKKWRPLLAPGGYMVVSDFCWFQDNPAPELCEMFLNGNADVGGVEARRKSIAKNGYRLCDEFVLPSSAWWENFLVPKGECLARFRKTHAGNPEALAVAAKCQQEIDLYQKYPGAYGYVFFVMQPEEK